MSQGSKDVGIKRKGSKKVLLSRWFISLVLLLLLVVLPIVVFLFVINPSVIRSPKVAHHHFRMQLYVEGANVNFSGGDFQETFEKGICDGGITDTPIHVHDNKDQYIHIHWKNITGGQVLKYYGLNRTDIIDDFMGVTFRENWYKPELLEVRSKGIPKSSKNIFIYQVKDGEAVKRDKNDFLYQDLEKFFGQKSSLTLEQEDAKTDSSLFGIKALAHGIAREDLPAGIPGQTNETQITGTSEGGDPLIIRPVEQEIQTVKIVTDEKELKKLNDVIGDVIIFVQDEEPTSEQVNDKLDDFVQLEASSCGG